MTQSLHVNTEKSYTIEFMQNLFESTELLNYCKTLAPKIVILSDDTVANYYGKNLKDLFEKTGRSVYLLTFPPGEHYKTRNTKEKLEDEMLAHGCLRDTAIIALGGGIVTDVAGFLAATYCRGVPVVYIPTTLLAMVDASIGGKTGVNTPLGKNLIGTFTQPVRVYIDVCFLDTLPEVEFNNGLVELIKHAVIADKDLFQKLATTKVTLQDKNYLEEMIYQSCDIKRKIVEQDPTEKGMRQLLNFGHTVGHAFEAASRYTVRHGEAVAMGMVVECYFSVQLSLFKKEKLHAIKNILQLYGLPLTLPADLTLADLLPFLERDKKNLKGQVYSLLLEDIGQPYILDGKYAHQITPQLLEQGLDWFLAQS